MEPDLVTKLIFNGIVNIEVSSAYEETETVLVTVYNDTDKSDLDHRSFELEPDEIDLFIATLNLYKNRILAGRKGGKL